MIPLRPALRRLTAGTAAALLTVVAFSCPARTDEPPREETGISLETFRDSQFARLFKAEDYAGALQALEELLVAHPRDPLLLRYRAITLDRLGRTEEAVGQFQQLLKRNPQHVPTRYYLGLALARAGRTEQARQELEWVSRNSRVAQYAKWARSALSSLAAGAPPAKPPRWFLNGSAGWEWDSNVSLKPSDKALASAGDQNADRFSVNLLVDYALLREPDRAADLIYTTRNSANDDSFNELNFFTQEAALSARRRSSFFGKPLLLGGRFDTVAGFLEEDLFSWANRLTFSGDTRLTPRTRSVLAHQVSWTDFGPDGSNPPQTSRDGLYQDLSLTEYLYTAGFQRYLSLTQGYRDTRVRGGNFERRGTFSRIGLHTPLTRRLAADLSVGFAWNRYPRFSSLSGLDRQRRRDTDCDFSAALSWPVTPRLVGRLFYRFVTARNRNDFFEYDRHLAGVEFYF